MRKAFKRTLALFCVCALTLAMAGGASARSISWGDDEGGKTLYVEYENHMGILEPIPNAGKVYHEEGHYGDFCSFFGDYDITVEASYLCPPAYEPYLRQVLDDEGQTLSLRITGQNKSYVIEVDPDAPSSYYCVGVYVECNYGTWFVTNCVLVDGLSSRALPINSGPINYVPWDPNTNSGLDCYYFTAVPCESD